MNYYELAVEAEKSLQETIHTINLLVEEDVLGPETSSALAELKSALDTLEYVTETLIDWDEDYDKLTIRKTRKWSTWEQGFIKVEGGV